MAAPVTANYSLPLSVYGHVALQNTVRNGFTLIDAALKSLQDQVTAHRQEFEDLATVLDDSNSALINHDPH